MWNSEGPMSLHRSRLAALDIKTVVDYLKERGWVDGDRLFTEVSIIATLKPGRRRYEVLIPRTRGSENYVGWMNDAVIEIARYEGRKGWEVLEDLEKREGV